MRKRRCVQSLIYFVFLFLKFLVYIFPPSSVSGVPAATDGETLPPDVASDQSIQPQVPT